MQQAEKRKHLREISTLLIKFEALLVTLCLWLL